MAVHKYLTRKSNPGTYKDLVAALRFLEDYKDIEEGDPPDKHVFKNPDFTLEIVLTRIGEVAITLENQDQEFLPRNGKLEYQILAQLVETLGTKELITQPVHKFTYPYAPGQDCECRSLEPKKFQALLECVKNSE